MTIRDFRIQLQIMYFNCFSLHFSIIFLLNELFVDFLVSLWGKMLHFNKFEKQNVEF